MQISQFNTFKNLHYISQPLVLTNVWDAASAAIVEKNGAKAIATSSASLAWANGYPDGEKMPLELLFSVIKQIRSVTQLPLSVDLETGYSQSPNEVAQTVQCLVDIGVVGINIEDGDQSPELLINKIKNIRNLLGQNSVFINARTDVFLQQLVSEDFQLTESIKRAKAYLAAGADGIFVPGMVESQDIKQFGKLIKAPLNIMLSEQQFCNIKSIKDAGVQRISTGPNSFIECYKNICPKRSSQSNVSNLNFEYLNQLF